MKYQRGRPARSMLVVAALDTSLTACAGAAEVLDTPDLRELESEYDQPTAAVDQTGVEDAIRRIPPLRDLEAGFRAAEYVMDGVDRAGDAAAQQEFDSTRSYGSIRVTLRCPGGLDARNDAEDDGTVELTFGIDESLIKRGVAGVASHCVLGGARSGIPVHVELDGPFAFDLGRDVTFRERGTDRLLMVISGSIEIDGIVLRNLSARWTDTRLEYLHLRHDGTTVVAEIGPAGTAIRDRNAVWNCSDGTRCTLD